ncbi:MAG TPA: PfkB family carbohydrate kinase [Accumulibacter sp.]|uniref:PfkB family carbohydrate kinase n=2 Tax=Accumulibacter sp. TaxID=2053492 RepID=UPI002C8F2DA1|nr:PfkB family carbohydrate kinase [Accumulibacter sp.]HNL98438.1 PfkB family carbohydrate kinase [Accumulibacter sp.]
MRPFVLGNYMNAHFMSVDRLPDSGESLVAKRVFREHGGKGLNLGLGLHRLGANVDMLLAVGADDAGEAVRRALVAEGMRDELFLTLGDASGFGVGFIASDGGNFLAVHLGANALLGAQHVERAAAQLARADWLLAHFELPDTVIRHAFGLARGYGIPTYLNPSPWRNIDRELLAMTDVLVVNSQEAALLFDLPDAVRWSRAEWSARLSGLATRIGWRGRVLAVTLAADGSVALGAAGRMAAALPFVIEQVDATGAGDAFGCGLVDALSRGEALSAALRFGNACGAHVAARAGIFAHLPRKAELADLLGRAKPAGPD